jgi:hypothetical protein
MELARVRQRLGISRAGRIVGKVRHNFGCEQPHRFLRRAEIKRAKIDLQRGMLEVAG